jgi:hypothetical protein
MKTVDPVWMIDKQEGVSSLQLEQLSQLTKHRLSDNAGFVEYFFPTRLRPLGDERHFALVEISAIPTKARS